MSLFMYILVGEDECIDLESNDLKEFLDTQSILLKDYSSSPMTQFTLKRWIVLYLNLINNIY